ncbi:MAG: biopolymer transporter ExbD [Verrucomicrobia bacterium]|nr:biopolymer transporter ExbD [Verrucomicrobiota bacterium]
MNNAKDESLTFVESVGQPLFQRRLRVHRRQSNRETPFNLIILIDLAFIGLLFAILLTRLVTLPGMNIDFVKTDMQVHATHSNVVILTLENTDTIFFDGGIYNMQTIESALNGYLKKEASRKGTSLIIRSDSQIDLESFLKLCSMVEDAGYKNIQILGQSEAINGL